MLLEKSLVELIPKKSLTQSSERFVLGSDRREVLSLKCKVLSLGLLNAVVGYVTRIQS